MKVEKEFYWLAIDGETKPQWKKPFSPAGKSAVFKLMRNKKSLLGQRKFEIYSSRRNLPLWESASVDLIFDMS